MKNFFLLGPGITFQDLADYHNIPSAAGPFPWGNRLNVSLDSVWLLSGSEHADQFDFLPQPTKVEDQEAWYEDCLTKIFCFIDQHEDFNITLSSGYCYECSLKPQIMDYVTNQVDSAYDVSFDKIEILCNYIHTDILNLGGKFDFESVENIFPMIIEHADMETMKLAWKTAKTWEQVWEPDKKIIAQDYFNSVSHGQLHNYTHDISNHIHRDQLLQLIADSDTFAY